MSLSDNVQVVGKAKDGVLILKPVTKPKNITMAQARAIIRKVRQQMGDET